MTKEKLDELEPLVAAAVSARAEFEAFRAEYPTRNSANQREYLRRRSVADDADAAVDQVLSLAGIDELLRSARLALKAREWLVEHSDITGVALAGAEQAGHKSVTPAFRALAALRKEFGLDA